MVVRRNAVYDQYCELPKGVVDAFLNAPSMGQYFNANIAGTGTLQAIRLRDAQGVINGNAGVRIFQNLTFLSILSKSSNGSPATRILDAAMLVFRRQGFGARRSSRRRRPPA